MTDIVISYKKEEKARVAGIAAKLRALRLATWFDEDLPNGISFDDSIRQKLAETSCVLVCWTPGALASDFVRAEAMIGHNEGKLTACLLEPVPALDSHPPFNLVQYADLSDWKGDENHAEWRRLILRIGELVGRPGLGEYVDLQAQGDPKPAGLAAWKTRYPQDPLAQADWNEAKLQLRRAGKIARKRTHPKKGGALWAASLIVLILLVAGGGGLAAWWYAFGGQLGPGERFVTAYEAAASGSESLLARADARAQADVARRNEMHTSALADQAETYFAMYKTQGRLSEIVQDLRGRSAARACRFKDMELAPVYLIPAARPDGTTGEALAIIDCNNSTRLAGQIDPATGNVAGRRTVTYKDAAGVPTGTFVYNGYFRDFTASGLGVLRTQIGDRDDVYLGEMTNDYRTGVGVALDHGQPEYEGHFDHGKTRGFGVRWLRNGTVRGEGPFCCGIACQAGQPAPATCTPDGELTPE